MSLLRRRDTPENIAFWDFVEHTSRQLTGDAPLCAEHPEYAPNQGKPKTLCEACWGFYVHYKRMKALSGWVDSDSATLEGA